MYPGAYVDSSPDKPAVIMGTSGATTTFRELDAGANRLSRVLRAAGVEPGGHVALCLPNHPRYLEVLWGCHYAGAVYTAVSSRLTSAELAYIVADCGATVFITSHHLAAQATDVMEATPSVATRLMMGGTIVGYGSYEDALAGADDSALSDRAAGTDMLYSSGTTGRPKGVALEFSGEPLESSPTGVTMLCQLLFGFTQDTIYLSPAPMYHAAPLRFTMAATALGATAVVMEHFDAEQYLGLVERHRVTASQVVPTMFVRLLKLPDEVRTRYDVSSLETVVHAAAPCPVPVKRQIIEWFGPVVHEYYAGTEGNGFVYCDSEQWLAHAGTVGRPLNCTLHICGADGQELPPGAPGTVYFESDVTFEYHNDPAKTAASRHPRGWTTLGDVGYLDADGYLYLTDRAAYMIISGGVNIYPQEAENVLVTHPDVVDVAVFGVPDDEFGETVKAVVQPVAMPVDDEAAAQLASRLSAYCRSQLADIKCPRSIDFRPELPRHPTGKLYKRLLKDEYWAAAGRSI